MLVVVLAIIHNLITMYLHVPTSIFLHRVNVYDVYNTFPLSNYICLQYLSDLYCALIGK